MPILFPPLMMASTAFVAYGPAVTLSPSDKSADITLSNGNLTAESSATDSGWDSVRATAGKGSGQWYWEMKIILATNTVNFLIGGAGNASMTLTDYAGASASSVGCGQATAFLSGSGVATSGASPPAFAVNDVISFALDMARGELYVAKNGTWIGSGSNPATRVNPLFTGLVGVWYPALSIHGSGGGVTGGEKWTANFGATAFVYALPN